MTIRNLSQKSIASIEKLLTQAVRQNEPGVAVGIARGGRLIWSGARGLANLDARTPFTTKTAFRICSISKQFACALAMRDARAGRLDLSAHPGRYLPWARGLDASITLAHCMQNKSGIRDQWVMAMMMGAVPTQPFTLEDGNEAARRTPDSMFEPGSRNLYCNVNFEIVGQTLEAISGKPYADLLAEHILEPLGMRDTFLGVDTSRTLPGDSRGYRFHDGAWQEEENGLHWAASAGIVSTVEDLLKWAACLRDPEGTGLPWVADILQTTPFNDGAPAQYASGINHVVVNGRAMLAHGGGLRGWKSLLVHYVREDTSIVVFMNRNNTPKGKMPRALSRAIAEAIGIDPVWKTPGTQPKRASLPPKSTGAWFSREQGLLVLLRDSNGGAEAYSFLDWSALYRTPDAATIATEDGDVRFTFRDGGMLLVDHHENVCAPLTRIAPRRNAVKTFKAGGTYRCAPLAGIARIVVKRNAASITFAGIFGEGESYPLTVLDDHTAYFDIARGVDEAPPGRVLLVHDPKARCIELSATLARRVVFRR
jgi:D-aminopeptidase